MKNLKIVFFLFLISCLSILAQDKKFITYKVKQGESIQSISKALSITPYDLLKLNPDVKDNVSANDIIIIPNQNYDPLEDISNADLSGIGEKDIVVDKFIYHEVIPKETIYSIVKSFNISEEELKASNPFLAENGLKIGQVIRIPLKIDETELNAKDDSTQPYLVKAKETKYSIAKKFGISIEDLEALNPKIALHGLQIDDVILVPILSETEANEAFVFYEVQKLETLYSITKKFDITEDELLALNPEISDGIKEGMLLKLPNNNRMTKPLFVDVVPAGSELKMAMMLPFKSRRDSLNFETDRLLQITTDFYFGALMAIDSLKKQGLSIHMKVYDTENNREVSRKISNEVELQEFDLVVGPMFLSNVKAVSTNLKYGKPYIASPISTKDHSNIDNKKLIQERASLDNYTEEMMDFVKANYENQDLIVIKNDTKKSEQQFNRIIEDIKALNPEKEVKILEPKDGYIKPDDFKVFRDTLDRNIVNWFFVTDTEPAYLGDVFNNLGVFPEVDSLMVFGFEKDRNYNKIDNNFLARVHFHYPSNSFIDYNHAAFQQFEATFKRKYYSLPSSYAVEGFDVTYDLLMRLAEGSDFFDQGVSERIATKYEFIENTSGGILNKGIFIVKYDGLEEKVINPFKQDSN
ncbi:LysM peptidoglycan-binding domain-containing protein [Lutimonas sp.]|uniref:LysM peptidoglycan-binding domain-containing protein n=1 Tax=Lutimonas sp. TaxID=1872403 RepID=UPI003D9B5384